MRKVLLIAGREFHAAVVNKGFVIGLLLMPVLAALAFIVLQRVMSSPQEPVRGQIAIVDPTGVVAREVRHALTPDAIARRRGERTQRVAEAAPAEVREIARESAEALQDAAGTVPDLQVVEPPPSGDLGAAKAWLTESTEGPRRLALVVVHPDAVKPPEGGTDYGTYQLYVPAETSETVESLVRDALRESIVGARMRDRNLNHAEIEALMAVDAAASVRVTAGDEQETNPSFNRALPFVFGGLLVFGVMIGGQTLLTQMVEEKSSRVIEVLLSAVSPLQLMAGKILGQMAVSLLVLAIYIGMGLAMLASFAMFGLLDPRLILYLLLFFVITYLVFASIFGAVGAAVNEMREAQSLMTPVMLLLMAPWLFGPAIGRDPGSTFSVAMSFLPPLNTMAMMIRLASSTPPPAWQVWLTAAIGVGAAAAAMWFAAKVFKIGLLMHGKPPNFATLIRWARAA